MQFRTKVVLIFAVSIFILIVAGYILIQNIEIVKEKVYVGLKGEALTNPYLAVERLLKKRDFKVDYVYSEYQIEQLCQQSFSYRGTIFFLAKRDTFNQQTLDTLLKWVESGGNLVADLPYYSYGDDVYSDTDFFAQQLGVEISNNPDIHFIHEESEIEEYGIEVMLPGIDKKLSVTLDNFLFLKDTENSASWAVQQNDNNLLLQFKKGLGYISLTGSLSFMGNTMIGEKDNVALFWYLTTLGGRKGDVWFVLRNEAESFWEILFRYSWMFFISLLLFIILFIWKSSMRFGPLITITDTVRRSLIEHVFACGKFLWNKKLGPALLEALKQAVKYKIKTKLPLWDTLLADDQLELLKQRTELEAEVLNVLFIAETRKELTKKDFYTKAKLLERIYEKV